MNFYLKNKNLHQHTKHFLHTNKLKRTRMPAKLHVQYVQELLKTCGKQSKAGLQRRQGSTHDTNEDTDMNWIVWGCFLYFWVAKMNY